MIKQTAAIALTATLASLGMSLPALAQDADNLPTVIDRDELLNDDVGLPEGTEDGADTGLPDAGEVLDDNVIIEDDTVIEDDDVSPDIDGESEIPARDVFRLEDPAIEYQIELDDDNIDVPEVENPGAINVPEVDEPGRTDDDNDGTVIYPPADSVNDLEPEDILR